MADSRYLENLKTAEIYIVITHCTILTIKEQLLILKTAKHHSVNGGRSKTAKSSKR